MSARISSPLTEGRSHTTRPRADGFTLIEIVIAIVLVGILAVVGSSVISDSVTTANISNRNQADISQARYAIERLARELRQVKLVAGTYQITLNPSPPWAFTTTNAQGVDQAVCVNLVNNNLRFAYAATCATSGELLATQVQALALSFWDISGNTPAANAAIVRFVQIDMTTNDALTGITTVQRTRVGLRNFPGV